MRDMMGSSIFQALLSFILVTTFLQEPTLATRKPYVVYLGGHSHGPNPSPADAESATNYHYDLLGSVLGSHEKAKEAIMYSYNKHINGFAALLEDEEAAEIKKNPNVMSVFRTRGHKLHTTRSWDFLDLEKNGKIPGNSAWRIGRFGQDTIIANIDTGVWPEHPSFNDHGIRSVPSRWRGGGRCDIHKLNNSEKIVCNRKLIGARFFSDNYEAENNKIDPKYHSARDFEGHGTHTLAIAGGGFVPSANLNGNGNGTAKGGSPRARVVAYKVCWSITEAADCYDADILSAFEQAISDGVDVISISIGGYRPYAAALFTDGISIGSFHAVDKGILVVCSAGNDGPDPATVSNVSPWLFTIAASTIDRQFVSNVSLGHRQYAKAYHGRQPQTPPDIFATSSTISTCRVILHQHAASVNTGLRPRKFYPVITSVDARLPNATIQDALLCKPGTLDPSKVRGKLLVCVRGGKIRSVTEGAQALIAGAAGMIMNNGKNSRSTAIAENQPLAACDCMSSGACVSKPAAHKKTSYSSFAYFTKARTDLGTRPAPIIPSFSSRGPSPIQPLILKPDVAAPGVEIISAFSLGTSPSNQPVDTRSPVPFNVLSGTSQACPHVSGVAGLLKTLHPDWSPAAIKSAIMTTATILNKTNGPILDDIYQVATPFDYGSGQIQPNLAMDPGLVYNLSTFDYLNFVCAIAYDQDLRKLYYGKSYPCPKPTPRIVDFNYPSITVGDLPINVTRTVTNVGPPSTYSVSTNVRNGGFLILVQPNTLTFRKKGEKKTFRVFLQPTNGAQSAGKPLFGDLSWTDGKHTVRSPIVVLANIGTATGE